MASIVKTETGYRVHTYVRGVRKSKSFKTKRECTEWAAAQINAVIAPAKHKTFKDLLEKYRDEISANKKGSRWEQIRIDKFLADEAGGLASKLIGEINRSDIANWRDRKIHSGLSGSSVLREWTILSNAFNIAIREWEWLRENPMATVKRPRANPPRERLISDEEIEKLDYVTGYSADSNLVTVTQRVGAAFHFALETAMQHRKFACSSGAMSLVESQESIHQKPVQVSARFPYLVPP